MAAQLRSTFYSRLGVLSGRARRLRGAERSRLQLAECRALGVEVTSEQQLAELAERL